MSDTGTTELHGSQSIDLADDRALWRVVSGRVDIFVVDPQGTELPSPRHHLLRIEAGRCLFGMGELDHRCRVRLVAIGGPGTQLRRHATLEAEDDLEEVAECIDAWSAQVCARMGGETRPAGSRAIEFGERLELDAPARLVSARPSVAWVRASPAARLLGAKEAITDADAPLPITDHSWIDCEPGVVAATATIDELERAGGWDFLDDFHVALVRFAAEDKRRSEAAALERALSRSRFDRSHTADALSRLVAAMDGSTAEHLGSEATPHTNEPLLAVMRVVGNELGASVQAPPPVIDGIPDVYTIDDIARASRLGHRRVSLQGQWWRRDVGPLVAVSSREDEDDEPVALVRTGRGYVLHTPDGRSVRVSAGNASRLGDHAWSLYRLLPDRALSWIDLLRFSAHGSGGDLVRLGLVGLAGALLGLLSPTATQVLFDTIIPGALRTELVLLAVVLCVAGVATLAFQFVRDLSVMRLQTRADAALETAIWARLLTLPANFFRDYNAGDLADRVMGLSAAQQRLAGSTMSTLLSSGFSIFSLLVMFLYAPKLAWIATAVTVVACMGMAGAGLRRIRLEREIAGLRGQAQGFVLQAVTAIAKLRVARAERRAFARWAHLFSRQRALQVRARTISNVIVSIRQTLPILTMVAVFAVVAEPEGAEITTGAFVGFLVAFGQFIAGALQATGTLVELTTVAPYFERAGRILDAVPETNERKPQLGDIHGRLELSHIRFRYREDLSLVLDDVSLTIEPGEFVALVGKSGSGKSTLFRLLLGFEQPTGGAIYVDGHDINGIDVRDLRRQVGTVLQTGRVMAGSIFENISASSNATMDEAWEAARMAGLADDLERMPMGMHTELTSGGGTLSGGQRQRLLIARALVKRPRIVLFDEATSALDNHTQAVVSRSLESLRLTRVVIAHRLSTIRNADRIFVLDKGRIAQVGTFDELIKQPGPFADLAKRQMA